MNFLQSVNAKHIFGNLEYPVDELRRDLRVCLLAKEQGVKPVFVHDKLIIEPGKLSTLQGKPYTVRSSTLLSIGLLSTTSVPGLLSVSKDLDQSLE
jgi:deoxyribodipyrimidine photolyase